MYTFLKSTLLILALLAGQLLTVTAQEVNQRQRPRRVNGTASKAPSQNALPARTEEVD